MKSLQPMAPPTRKEQFTLRLMITLGLISMFFFLKSMFSVPLRGYTPLYWMLITTFIFTCLKILHEWLHYLFITLPKTPEKTKTYTVDIFTTFCAGEPYGMIKDTLTAIQRISYPHQTYLCDEADDAYLKELCRELGVNHVTRVDKIDAKAGNINNALKHSSGELCVVLDPDHVPLPEFLDPIVSHFNDPKVGFVQIVQAYKNNEENLIAKGAAQQTYQFYGPMMMTMNKYGTVLAIGANCTFRRSALESIGGHAAGLAEDMHTAMKLHSKGWKSVYVPRILARGLVPSTLSAYYKQQLKWSRGVFDLLLHAYPRLFKGFSWQQKIHYGVLPIHYLSGVMYLITFLIPVCSLFFDLSPMRMDIGHFGLTILPFIISTLMIRHFVQWWVTEDEERGFHIVGGLLMIGTWWIFILGLVYTIIGKKVPYVPTPKDGNEANNWPLNIPNLFILILSVAAIIYGLYFDWSPYTIIMACFAGLNSLIMCFNILASRQQEFRKLKARYPSVNGFMAGIKELKVRFWLIRRRLYTGIRSAALMITIILCCSVLYFAKVSTDKKPDVPVLDHKKDLFLAGIFSPANFDGISSVNKAKEYQRAYGRHFDIISVYVPWGDKRQCYIPEKTIDSIYSNGSVPMITWEPWQNLFNDNKSGTDKKVFKKIAEGSYDQYLQRFCNQIIALNKPVYIRFAHEMDNPFYPWSQTGNNTDEEFKAAWKYVYNFFLNNAAYNVIWVWNPWKAEAVEDYFPGAQYVDWIGVTNLNYGSQKSTQKWMSMEALYKPFHQNAVFRSGIPVMLAEMGSLAAAGRQKEWFDAAFRAKRKFPEIKGCIFFNSVYDKNVPDGGMGTVLDWNVKDLGNLRKLLKQQSSVTVNKEGAAIPDLLMSKLDRPGAVALSSAVQIFFKGSRGINYNRAQDWKKNYQTVTMRDMIADFDEMKKAGVNSIKRYGPDIYDRNILKTAEKTDIQVHYGYWISDELDFAHDKQQLEKLKRKILNSVDDLKDEKNIRSWNIGNAVLQKLSLYYYKPELLYQQDAYILWLKNLVAAIKKADPDRSVTVDVEVSENLAVTIERLKRSIPQIDAYGFVADSTVRIDKSMHMISKLKVPYFYSDVDVPVYQQFKDLKAGVFIANWQDESKVDQIRLNGVKDYYGRQKYSFLQLAHIWGNRPLPARVPQIKILKPAMATNEGEQLSYHALIKKDNKWIFADAWQNGLKFEWRLAKVDRFEHPVSIKIIADGASIKLTIPNHPADYRLYLYVIKDNKIFDVIESELNTPLSFAGKY